MGFVDEIDLDNSLKPRNLYGTATLEFF